MCQFGTCQNKDTHFVIINKYIFYSCMYHFCRFYDINIKDESKIYKQFLFQYQNFLINF